MRLEGQRTKGVLAEDERLAGDLVDQAGFLRLGRKVDAPLEDAAAVSMGGDLHAVASGGIAHI
eukprot:scaffold3860_cov39-Prasinocladus_malaysianus.AAC.2